MTDDPNFYHPSRRGTARPSWVTGFVFDPASQTIDFSDVPGFSLARLREIRHVRTGAVLYTRPREPDFGFGLTEIDGEPAPRMPTVGSRLKLKASCAGMAAGDELICSYDPPTG